MSHPPACRPSLHPLALAVALLPTLGTSQVLAQQAAGAAAPATERVVITGSNLRRSDAETPSPVLTLSSADIVRTGYTSLSEVLQHITANNMGSLSQSTPAAFGAGGSGISLRGLTVGATLVLIDGHRMASYPLPDDGQRDFVDIASIPIDAVERVEVLKDGASAIYGSDAMAGVINVILKKSHKGSALHVDLGQSGHGDGRTLRVSGIRGFGSTDGSGPSGYVSVSYRQQKPILLGSRPGLAGSDWTAYGGEDLGLGTPNPELQVAPRTRNLGLLGKLTAPLGRDWSLDLSASVLGSQASQVGLTNAVSPSLGITSFVFGPRHPQPQPTVLNNTNVIDPATGAPVDAGFDELGAQRSRTDTRSYRLVAEASGSVGDWELRAALGLTQVRTTLDMHNFISLPALQAALNGGRYVIGADNSAAARAEITPFGRSTSSNTLHFASLRASRDLMKLDGGNLTVGTGVEYMRRKLDEHFPEGFSGGAQASNIYAFGVGSQTISAAYAELAAPLTKALELNAAARIDHYDTYGSSTTPKLGIKFVPLKALTLRGTYARGFRAPNPVEIGVSGSSAGFLPPLVDSALCALATPGQPCAIPVGGTQLQLPGQDLKPEKSRSHTLGFVFEPTPSFNLSVDYYDIRITNQIVSVGLFGQAQIDNPAAFGTRLYRVNSPTVANAAPTDANDTILYGTYPFMNVGQTRTDGVDLDLRTRWDLGSAGRLTAQLQLSHMFHYTIDRFGVRYELAGTHGPSFVSTNTGTPRDRAALTLTWARGPLELSSTVSHISSFAVLDPSYDMPDCNAALALIFPNGAPDGSPLCRVGSFTEVGLNAVYQASPALSLRASVGNLFNRKAPVDAFASSSTGGGVGSGGAHYNPSLHQSGAVGRMFNVGLSYRF
ncbi:MAG: TonB-dependent receptor [Rubrivivax sp.]